MGKKILSTILAVVLVVGLAPNAAVAQEPDLQSGLTVQDSDSVSRGEWISKLVDTFSITVQDADEYPEDYFSDLDSSDQYYTAFMMAVDFGIIDVIAGEEVHPDDPATRDFAAHTLNYCLGFQLEDGVSYTFSDSSSSEHPSDMQVAVNRGWFELTGGKANAAQAITADESDKMISDATEVWHSTDGLAAVSENVQLAADVKEVPKQVSATLSEDGKTVSIANCPIELASGDKFAVYLGDDLPVAYEASLVSRKGDVTIVTINPLAAEDAYTSLVYGSEEEYDLVGFQEEEGVITQMYADIDEAAANGAETGDFTVQTLQAQGVSYKNGTLSYEKSFSMGSVKGSIAGMKVHKSGDLARNRYYASISGTVSLTATVKGNVDLSLPIGAVLCAGCHSTFSVVAKAEGKVSKTVSANFEVGVQYDPTYGFRAVKSFKKGKPGVSASANARVGFDANVSVGAPGVSASLGVDFGFEANYAYDRYGSGSPAVCQDIEGHLYAGAYANATIGVKPFKKPFTKRFDVWTAKNSPVRMHRHIEDGKDVGSCSRGKAYTYRYWRTGSYGSKWGYLLSGSGESSSGWGYNAAGEWVEYATYEYELDGTSATITKYHGNTRALIIPDTIDGYKVVGIGASSFEGNEYLTTVQIPEGVTVIEDLAFANCKALADVDIPDTVTTISGGAFGSYNGGAFRNCTSLSGVKLSKSLTNLGGGAFYNCDSITSITLPASLMNGSGYVDGFYGGPFTDCDGLKYVEFEKGFTVLADHVLDGCTGLETVTIPEGVTSLNTCALRGCENLKNVKLPSTLTTIGTGAFAGCTSLESIDIPDSVTLIAGGYVTVDGAFENCTALKSVKLPKSLKTLDGEAFAGCTALEGITIPKSLESCGGPGGSSYYDGPFAGCSALRKVILEEGMKAIPACLFYGCSGLETVSIPSSATVIESKAFANCKNLKSITIPSTVTRLRDNVFANCGLLSEIVIPDTVEEIGNSICAKCTSLKSVKLSQLLEELPADSFAGCTSLEKVDGWSDAMETIGSCAFNDCTALKSVDLPSGLTRIGWGAFGNCDGLTKVVLPDSVHYIDSGIFNDCDSLVDVTLSAGLETISSGSFKHCDSLESIVLPYRVQRIESDAFAECTKLTSLTIPRATTIIADVIVSYPDKTTIYGVAGTKAESYAKEKSIKFVARIVPVEKITLTPSEIAVGEYGEVQVSASIKPINFTDEPIWKSMDVNVATVDENGKVEAQNLGETTVKLIVGKASADVKVKVVKAISSISLDDHELELDAGKTVSLKLTIDPSDAYEKKIAWSSSDPSVATVDQQGNVTALKKGEVTITAETSSNVGTYNLSDYCDITVVDDATVAKSVTELESAHPYDNEFTRAWVYTLPGAESLNVTFDTRTKVEEDSDYIEIRRGNGALVAEYTGSSLAGKTVNVVGDTVRIRLISDKAMNDWGFKVTDVRVGKISLSRATVAVSAQTYTGKALNPRPVVSVGGKTLAYNVDYTASYANNVKAGTATITITGKGSYIGSKSASFKINKAANPIKAKIAAKKTLKFKKVKKAAQKVAAVGFKVKAVGSVKYKIVGDKKVAKRFTVSKSGVLKVKKKTPRGVYAVYVRVSAKGDANHSAGMQTVRCRVAVK